MSKHFLSDVNEKQTINESFQKEKFERIKPDLTKYYIMVGVVLVAIVSLYFILNQKVSMVDMTDWSLSDAQSWASKNDMQLIATTVYDISDVETVLSQSIAVSEKISKNTSIQVSVSLGPDPDEIIELPAFDENWTKSEIINWLKEVKIDDYTFTTKPTNTLDSNLFIEYQIEVDVNQFTRSNAITFVVTSNSSSDPVTVVDFSNYTRAQIDEWAEDNNVEIKYTYAYSDSVQRDKVIDQSVDKDEEIDQESTIKVTLSLGEAINVVDFSSYDQTEAKAWANENGIDLTITTSYNNSTPKGIAIYQDIAKYTTVQQGTKLNLVYSLGSQITLSSYTNKALTDLEAFIESQNALNANLGLKITYQYSNNISINQIISHSPTNTSIGIGSEISVVVSLGRLVSVPDFTTTITADNDTVAKIYNAILDLCNSPTNPINARIKMVDIEGDTISIIQSTPVGSMISNADLVDITINY